MQVRFQGPYQFVVNGTLQAWGAVFTNGSGPWQGIFFQGATSSNSSLTGCTICGSTNSGIRITNSTPAITGCLISNNFSAFAGGGINAGLASGSLTIADCAIVNNSVTNLTRTYHASGGGIQINGNATIIGSLVANNTCFGPGMIDGGWGRAVGAGVSCVDKGQVVLRNSIVTGNLATQAAGVYGQSLGGGIFVSTGAGLSMFNCQVTTNRMNPGGWGSAIATWTGTIPISLVNCTIVGNTGDAVCPIYNYSASYLYLTNTIIYYNLPAQQICGLSSLRYCNIQGLLAPGEGNISVPPQLDPITLLPQLNSPCIDSGSTNPVFNDVCLVPCGASQGGVRNDLGYSGGPGGCEWFNPCQSSITVQPQDQKGCETFSCTFEVSASGDHPLRYQWFFNTNTPLPNATDKPILNATNASLILTNLQLTNAGLYYVVVSNAYGSVQSHPALLVVRTQCPPIIVTQPRDQKGCLGGSATFTVVAKDADPMTYQWYFNTNEPLTDATNASFTLTDLKRSNEGTYHVVVSNPFDNVASSQAVLRVYEATVDVQVRDYFGFMYAGLNIGAQPGTNYDLRYTTDARNTNFSTWTLLERKTMTNWTWFYFDMESARLPYRFYGVKQVP